MSSAVIFSVVTTPLAQDCRGRSGWMSIVSGSLWHERRMPPGNTVPEVVGPWLQPPSVEACLESARRYLVKFAVLCHADTCLE